MKKYAAILPISILAVSLLLPAASAQTSSLLLKSVSIGISQQAQYDYCSLTPGAAVSWTNEGTAVSAEVEIRGKTTETENACPYDEDIQSIEVPTGQCCALDAEGYTTEDNVGCYSDVSTITEYAYCYRDVHGSIFYCPKKPSGSPLSCSPNCVAHFFPYKLGTSSSCPSGASCVQKQTTTYTPTSDTNDPYDKVQVNVIKTILKTTSPQDLQAGGGYHIFTDFAGYSATKSYGSPVTECPAGTEPFGGQCCTETPQYVTSCVSSHSPDGWQCSSGDDIGDGQCCTDWDHRFTYKGYKCDDWGGSCKEGYCFNRDDNKYAKYYWEVPGLLSSDWHVEKVSSCPSEFDDNLVCEEYVEREDNDRPFWCHYGGEKGGCGNCYHDEYCGSEIPQTPVCSTGDPVGAYPDGYCCTSWSTDYECSGTEVPAVTLHNPASPPYPYLIPGVEYHALVTIEDANGETSQRTSLVDNPTFTPSYYHPLADFQVDPNVPGSPTIFKSTGFTKNRAPNKTLKYQWTFSGDADPQSSSEADPSVVFDHYYLAGEDASLKVWYQGDTSTMCSAGADIRKGERTIFEEIKRRIFREK